MILAAVLGLTAASAAVVILLLPRRHLSPPPGEPDPQAKVRAFVSRIAANPRDVQARLQLGLLHLQNAHYMAALEELKLARSHGEDSPETIAALGRSLARLDRFDEAQRELGPAVERNPKDPHLTVGLASILAVQGDRKSGSALLRSFAARAGYLSETRIKGGEAREVLLLMRALNAMGDSETAGKLAEAALGVEPRAPDAYMVSGQNLLARGQVEKAVERLTRASELMPESAQARELHGDALAGLDARKDAALERWLAAMELKSRRPETYFRAGEVLAGRREFEAAAAVYTRAGVNTSNRVEAFSRAAATWEQAGSKTQALYCRATAAAAARKHKDALERYRELSRQPESEWRKRGLDGVAEMYRVLGKPREFLHAAREAAFTQRAPDYLRIANAYLMLGDAANRERHLRQAMAKDPNLAGTVYSELGASAERKGDLKLAIDLYEKAVEAAPGDSASWLGLARLNLKRSGSESAIRKAVECAGRAAAAGPTDSAAFAQLGEALSIAGDSTRAKQAFQHAVDLAPRNPAHYRRLAAELRKLREEKAAAECMALAQWWEGRGK